MYDEKQDVQSWLFLSTEWNRQIGIREDETKVSSHVGILLKQNLWFQQLVNVEVPANNY